MENERRLEILGILTIALSVFISVSLIGYNTSEEPSISSNVQVTNPMGILGIFTSHLFIKLGFGFSTIIIPLLGFVWGWFLFSKKELTEIIRGSAYGLGIMVLISVTVGVLSIQVTGEEPVSYLRSGLVGGVLAELFLDWLSIWGTALFLIAGYLMVIRGYFNLDYYGPFASGKEKWETWRTKEAQKKKQEEKEDAKRKHTQDLKSKIDAQKERDSAVIEPIDQEPEQLNIDPEETETVQETEYPEEEIEDDSDVRDDHFIAGKSPGVVADQAGPEEYKSEDHEPELEKGSKEDLNIEEIAKTEEVDIDAVVERQKPKRKYQLPSSELLANPVTISDNLSRDELVERANYLTQSMSTFGVEGKVVNVHPGPIITLFEVEPAEGIRVNKFVQLADDLA
nr:DNA translocase FtsK 4TM domain-containing protein [Candidatus Neomarinimicrobiota bacterium]